MPSPSPTRRRPGPAVFTAVAALAVASAGCGSDGGATTSTTVGTYDRLTAGLCAARAAAGRPDEARTAFFDRAHQALHELAAAVTPVDRSAAARLLEAKQAVEADFEGGDTGDLAGDLDALLDTTRRAVVAAGDPEPPSCQEAP